MAATAERTSRAWRLRVSERRLLLVVGDLACATIASVIALTLWARLDYLGPDPSLEFIQQRAPWFVLLPPLWIVLMVNLYDVQRAASLRQTVRSVIFAAMIGGILYLGLYFSVEGSLPRRGVLYFLAIAAALTMLWRWGYVRVFTAPGFLRRVLIVGAGESGTEMIRVIKDLQTPPFHVVGLIDDDHAKQGLAIEGLSVLGDNSCLIDVAEREGVTDIIVAIMGPMNGEMFQALLDTQQRGVEIVRMPVAYEELLGRVPIRHLESDWVLRSFVDELRVNGFYLLGRRVLDVTGATIGLFALFLLLPWVALAIWLESGRPIFLRQTRLGEGGHAYQVVKFRTMRQDAEADGQAHWALEEDPRTTTLGRFMRKMHLDEFPQFWNVLRGEMSLVGPRPERPELVADLERHIPFYRARLLVKPGITGWAQVNYHKGASIEGSAEKLEYDLYYIKHRNIMLDLWVLIRTFGQVLGFRGV